MSTLKKLEMKRDLGKAETLFGSKEKQIKTKEVKHMTVADAAELLAILKGLCNYHREHKLLSRSKGDPSLAGLDIYLCQFAGTHKPKPKDPGKSVRRSSSRKCGCLSRLTINFEIGYHHDKSQKDAINVREFGDQKVRVILRLSHNDHEVTTSNIIKEGTMTPRVRLVLEECVADERSWNQVRKKRDEETVGVNANTNVKLPLEFTFLTYNQFYNIKRRLDKIRYSRGNTLRESLCVYIEEIKSDGGFAELKKGDWPPEMQLDAEDLLSSTGNNVWSLIIITKWQAEVLKDNGHIVYLDSTHGTCSGFYPMDDTQLFSIVVKDDTTGGGAPVAFMLTNAARKFVISDFLRVVQTVTGVQLSTVVIDCDKAETKAVLETAAPETNIVWCKFHILQAFRRKIRALVDGDHAIAKKVTEDFKKIIYSTTEEESEKHIDYFLCQYKSYGKLIEYVRNQWLANSDFIIPGRRWDYASSASTNNYIEAFHKNLKYHCLDKQARRSTDRLVNELLTTVLVFYQAKHTRNMLHIENRAHDKAELAAKNLAKERFGDVNKMVVSLNALRFEVHSFTDELVLYDIVLCGEKCSCTCPYWNHNRSWCKHIFLAIQFSECGTLYDSYVVSSDSESPAIQVEDDPGFESTESIDVSEIPFSENSQVIAIRNLRFGPTRLSIQDHFGRVESSMGSKRPRAQGFTEDIQMASDCDKFKLISVERECPPSLSHSNQFDHLMSIESLDVNTNERSQTAADFGNNFSHNSLQLPRDEASLDGHLRTPSVPLTAESVGVSDEAHDDIEALSASNRKKIQLAQSGMRVDETRRQLQLSSNKRWELQEKRNQKLSTAVYKNYSEEHAKMTHCLDRKYHGHNKKQRSN